MTVRTVLRNPGWQLTPGMFASVLIGNKGVSRAVSIPVNAILQEGTTQVVFVEVSPGEFLRRTVRIGRISDGSAAVESGIEPGEEVAVGGNVLIEKEAEKLEGGKSES